MFKSIRHQRAAICPKRPFFVSRLSLLTIAFTIMVHADRSRFGAVNHQPFEWPSVTEGSRIAWAKAHTGWANVDLRTLRMRGNRGYCSSRFSGQSPPPARSFEGVSFTEAGGAC
ncbi:hypothetical protein ACQR50_01975 [Sphingomonas sp. Xoc002]|uniref:hypothetical protein n=1 Tax=Sphingomonas sp. Xoc002 TaxID=2837624 RepID=UPI003D179445